MLVVRAIAPGKDHYLKERTETGAKIRKKGECGPQTECREIISQRTSQDFTHIMTINFTFDINFRILPCAQIVYFLCIAKGNEKCEIDPESSEHRKIVWKRWKDRRSNSRQSDAGKWRSVIIKQDSSALVRLRSRTQCSASCGFSRWVPRCKKRRPEWIFLVSRMRSLL